MWPSVSGKVMKYGSKYYKLLRTSWSLQGKLFFEKSTLHGVRYIAEHERPFLEKFMWFCCVSVGAVATMIIIVSLWEKFQTNPTITGLDTDFHSWDVPFPAVTLCSTMPSNTDKIDRYISQNVPDKRDKKKIKKFLLKLTQLSYDTFLDFEKDIGDNLIDEDANLRDLAFQLMNTCEDIFESCLWKATDYNCCDGFLPMFTENGFCYSFNSIHYDTTILSKNQTAFEVRYIKETDSRWSLLFEVNANDTVKMPLYIHNSLELPTIDVQPQHIWDFKVDRISFSLKQTYTTVDTKQLSIKQRKCIFEDEVKLKIDDKYSYTACTQECRMETATRLCGCIPIFYPEIANFRHCKLKGLACIAQHLQEIKSVEKCSCELGCLNIVYEVEKLNENAEINDGKSSMEALFVSWPMVRYKREVLFGWVDLLVSFGGIAGLFLGFSMLSGVEIIYFFTLRACCMVSKEKNELELLQYEEASKPMPDYDLSLVPYFISKPTPGNGLNEVIKVYFNEDVGNKVAPMKNKKLSGPPFTIEFLP